MNKKDLLTVAFVGVLTAGVTSVGAQLAFAAEPVNPAPVAPLDGPPASFADIVQRVAPAVVSVDVEQRGTRRVVRDFPDQSPFSGEGPPDPFEQFRRFFQERRGGQPSVPIRGTGSGFFISADGYIVTNNHVVDGAEKVTVRTTDERTLPAKVIGRDPATDLAVLKVEGHGFPFVDFEDRAKPRVGDWVVAVGNPFNLGGTATAGIVSALARPNVSGSSYVDYMQIDAPINRGNSGGPTFDLRGRVVGVNSAIFSPSGGSVGIGFDIPADVAARVARQLIATGKVTRGYIGASVQEVTSEIAESLGVKGRRGALVADVTPGGPSDRAGLKSGDLILSLDGAAVGSAGDLTRAIAAIPPGREIALDVRRGDRRVAIRLRAGERPSEDTIAGSGSSVTPDDGQLGLAVAPNPAGGVRVDGVAPGSSAASRGLRPGDVIARVNSRPVNTAEDLRAAVTVARAAGRRQALFLVSRNGRESFVPIEIAPQGG